MCVRFIQVVVYVSLSFVFIVQQYFIVWMY